MSCNNLQILNFNHSVVVQSDGNTLVITDKIKCNSVTISQPVTKLLQINSPGPIGPPGPSGSNGVGTNATSSFTSQSIWTFNHNLGNQFVIIQTFDTNYNEIYPQNVQLVDSSSATITFATSQSGWAIASLGGAGNSVTASYSLNALSSSFSSTASYVKNAQTASYVLNAVSSSFATTASYALNAAATVNTSSLLITASITPANSNTIRFTKGDGTNFDITVNTGSGGGGGTGSGFPFSGSAIITGSLLVSGSGLTITGSLNVSGSITSSLFGTASYVSGSLFTSTNPALSASYALSSSNSLFATSASYASGSTSASYALTASYALNAGTTINTSSLVTTSSFNSFTSSINTFTASYNTGSFSGSLVGTASWANNATSASYASGSTSASFALTASYALNAGTTINTSSLVTTSSFNAFTSSINTFTSSYNTGSFSGSLIGTASWANNATSASYASGSTSASYAATSSYANNFTVANTLTVQTIVAQTITSSIDYVTGSTRFGSIISNTHQFTGSVSISGSLEATASWAVSASQAISSSNALTTSLAQLAQAISISTIAGASDDYPLVLQNINTPTILARNLNLTYNFANQRINATSSWANNSITSSYISGSVFTSTNPALSASYASGSTSASYALTASYALNAGTTTINTGSLVTTSSFNAYTSSVNIFTSSYNTGSFSGSLVGTASWANNVITSSYVTGSIFTLTNPALSASYALTASHVLNLPLPIYDESSLLTSSPTYLNFIGDGVTASLVGGGININIPGGGGGGGGSTFPFSGSAVITGSLLVSGSGITVTGSLNVSGSLTGSLLGTASYVTGDIFTSTNPALSASYASGSTSASFADFATSASYSSGSTSASFANFATSASYASGSTSASYALSTSFADFATSASYSSGSTSSSYALSTSFADFATSASYSSGSTSASFANFATSASYASGSTSASFAATASYVNGNIFTSINPVLSASYALSASNADTSSLALTAAYLNPTTQTLLVTGSLFISGATNVPNYIVGLPLQTQNNILTYDTASGQLAYTTFATFSSIGIQDEGTTITPAVSSINFIGNGVSAYVGANNTALVYIPGGGGGGGIFASSGSTLYTSTPFLISNFNTTQSILIGDAAGTNTPSASLSIFIGSGSAVNATYASRSIFLGIEAGNSATNASGSNFIGYRAGFNQPSSSFSNLIGYQAGFKGTSLGNIGSNNIIIGTNISLPANRANSINIGGIIFGTGSYSTITGNPFTGSLPGRIGINVVTPLYTLDVSGSGNFNNGLTVSGSTLLSGSLTVSGNNLTNVISGSLTISGSTLTARNNAVVSGSFIISGSETIIGSSIISGSLTISGSTLTARNGISLTGSLSMTTGSFTVATSSGNAVNTLGANSHIALINPNNLAQTVISFVNRNTVSGKIRNDYAGNMAYVTSGSGPTNFGNHYFFTQADGSAGGSLRLFISSSGQVGIGTSTPSFTLDINGTGRFQQALTLSNNLSVAGSTTATGLISTAGGISITGGSLTISNVNSTNVISGSLTISGSTFTARNGAIISGSLAVSGSTFTARNGAILSGSSELSGSLTVSGSVNISGLLNATASWAINALTAFAANANTASFITASGVFGPFGSNSILSASFALSSSNALTASFVNGNIFTSTNRALSASNALTASYVTGSIFTSANPVLSASYALNSTNTLTASFVNGNIFTSTNPALSASRAITASYVTGSIFTSTNPALSASFAATSSYANNFTVAGTLTAQTLVVQTITSSVSYLTGSTIFGSIISNTHQFTGSVSISGSLNVSGSGITGSLLGTSSWANNAITASYVTGSIYTSNNPALSASYASGSTSASYASSSTSASYAFNSTSASYASSSTSASYALSSSFAVTASYALAYSGSIVNAISASYASSSTFADYASYSLALYTSSGLFAPSMSGIQIVGSAVTNVGFNSGTGVGYIQVDTSSVSPTASFVTASGVFGPFGTSSVDSASYASGSTSASYAATASYANNFTVAGTLTAQTIVVQTITSSVSYLTGSTIFGSLLTNTHQFTGSVGVTGSLNVAGAGITGSLLGTASYVTGSVFTSANPALSASNALTSSFALRANIPNIYITTGSHGVSQVITGSLTLTGSALTARSGITVEAGGATITAGGLTVTAGGATVTAGGLNVNGGTTTLRGGLSIIGTTNNVISGSLIISGSILPAVHSSTSGVGFNLGSSAVRWNSIWTRAANINTATINFVEDNSETSLTSFKVGQGYLKSEAQPFLGSWYPITAEGSLYAKGDFATLDTYPSYANLEEQTYPYQYSPDMKVGINYENQTNLLRLGDSEANLNKGINLAIRNDGFSNPSPNSNTSLFQTEVTAYYGVANLTSSVTLSAGWRTDYLNPPFNTATTGSTLTPFISGSETLFILGHVYSYPSDVVPIAFKIQNPAPTASQVYYNEINNFCWTLYVTSGSTTYDTLVNVSNAINSCSISSGSSPTPPYNKFYVTSSASVEQDAEKEYYNLNLYSTITDHYLSGNPSFGEYEAVNNYNVFALSFDNTPIIFRGGRVYTPNTPIPNGTTGSNGSFSHYALGLRINANNYDTASGPKSIVQLGDLDSIFNKTRIELNDDSKYIYLSASVIGVSGSLVASRITGSLQGTASYASYALTASYALNGGGGGTTTILSGSNVTASFTTSSTWIFNHNLGNLFPIIQVYDTSFNEVIPQNITLTSTSSATITFPSSQSGYAVASVGGNSISASYALTASYFSGSISNAVSASYAATASYVSNAVSASYVLLAQSASYFSGSISDAVSASYAATASYVSNAVSASYVLNAISASRSISSSYALSSSISTRSISSSYSSFAVYASSSADANINAVLAKNLPFTGNRNINISSSYFTINSYNNPDGLFSIGNDGAVSMGDIANGLAQVAVDTVGDSVTIATDLGAEILLGTDLPLTSSIRLTADIITFVTGSGGIKRGDGKQVLFSINNTSSAATNGNLTLSTVPTASYVLNAQTASYVQTAQTASYVLNAQTASYVITAQTASYVVNAISASFALSSSIAETASYVQIAETASYVLNALSASFALSASWAPLLTLQQVLNNNHDLEYERNFQGTNAGISNTGIYINGFGYAAGQLNTGFGVNALGYRSAYGNVGNSVNGLGESSIENNVGNFVNGIGERAGLNNVYNYVNLLGYNASATANNQTVLAGQTYQARLGYGGISADRLYTLPNASGILALSVNNTSASSDGNITISTVPTASYVLSTVSSSYALVAATAVSASFAPPSTLQQVLDNNHDLSNGNNFQGTFAGNSNTGTQVNAFGNAAAQSNIGNNINALGNQAAYGNTGSIVNALGPNAAINNSGSNVNAFGNGAGNSNTYNYVNLFGYNASATSTNQTVFAGENYQARLGYGGLTADRSYTLPNASGTIALSVNNITASTDGNISLPSIPTASYALTSADARPYRSYIAQLFQSGSNAPVATILENTLGYTPTWTYEGVGQYYFGVTSSLNSENANKVAVFFNLGTSFQNPITFGYNGHAYWNGSEKFAGISTGYYALQGELSDNLLSDASGSFKSTFELRIYN